MSRFYKDDLGSMVRYDSLSEFFNQLKKPRLQDRDDASVSGDYRFTGTRSYDEAFDLMLSGDSESYDKLVEIKSETDKHYMMETQGKLKTYNHVVGYTPNVPNAIMGLPNSMINSKREPKKNKVVEIVVNRSRGAMTSTSQIEYEGALILSYIDALERDGYRVTLYVAKIAHNRMTSKPQGFVIPIKRATEPLNIKKTAFYLIHPSFLRRIVFRIDENDRRLPDITHSGYGAVSERDKARNMVHENMSDKLIIVDDSLNLNEDNPTEENVDKLRQIFKSSK